MSQVIDREVTEHVSTDSTCVRKLSYHGNSETLDVTFPSGDTYRYYGVPLNVWLHFGLVSGLNDSLGRFFNKWIRNHYDYRRLEKQEVFDDAVLVSGTTPG